MNTSHLTGVFWAFQPNNNGVLPSSFAPHVFASGAQSDPCISTVGRGSQGSSLPRGERSWAQGSWGLRTKLGVFFLFCPSIFGPDFLFGIVYKFFGGRVGFCCFLGCETFFLQRQSRKSLMPAVCKFLDLWDIWHFFFERIGEAVEKSHGESITTLWCFCHLRRTHQLLPRRWTKALMIFGKRWLRLTWVFSTMML